jgi:hypothetical protein
MLSDVPLPPPCSLIALLFSVFLRLPRAVCVRLSVGLFVHM